MKKFKNVLLILTIVFTFFLLSGLTGCAIENNRNLENNRDIENSGDCLNEINCINLEKIHFYLYNEYIALNTICELRAKISEFDIESTSAIISFDIDLFENTAEGKILRDEERNWLDEEGKFKSSIITVDVINDWIYRWLTGAYLHYETNANSILSEIEFSSEILLANLTPWAIITAECPEILYKDILAFAKNDNVVSVAVYTGNIVGGDDYVDGNRK